MDTSSCRSVTVANRFLLVKYSTTLFFAISGMIATTVMATTWYQFGLLHVRLLASSTLDFSVLQGVLESCSNFETVKLDDATQIWITTLALH